MKMRAAVLDQMRQPQPYAKSRPISVETVELDAPGPEDAEVEVGRDLLDLAAEFHLVLALVPVHVETALEVVLPGVVRVVLLAAQAQP